MNGGVATPLLNYLALHLAHPTEYLVLWHYAYGSLDHKIKGLLMWTRGLTDDPDKLMREIWAKDRLQGPSTDKPGLATDHPHTEVLCLSRPGRGQALRKAWLISKEDIQAYMDIDLSTDLHCLASLLSPLINGQADLAIGSRLLLGSEVQRSLRRELISRTVTD